MHYSELEPLFEESVAFPIAQRSVIDQLGEIEITTPTGDTVTLAKVLLQMEDCQYHSAQMLYNTVIGNLDDAFVARKYYDDRAGAHDHVDPRRSAQKSL
jgi:hypothetical protein